MRRSLAQMTMEAEPIVRIYESRLWRRGPRLPVTVTLQDSPTQ